MGVIVFYRKPKFHENFPWWEAFGSAQDAMEFINEMGEEYEAKAFVGIGLKELVKLADEGK